VNPIRPDTNPHITNPNGRTRSPAMKSVVLMGVLALAAGAVFAPDLRGG
jgi:hypothetical protein